MKTYNVHFIHTKDSSKEVVSNIKANGKIEARVNAKNMKGYFMSTRHKIEKVEEVV